MKIFPNIIEFLLKKINFSLARNLNNKRVIIPSIKGIKVGVKNEKWMSSVIEMLIPYSTTGVFLDVGANLGQTLIKFRTLTEEMGYIGFEPNPTCVFYLQELISENRFKECKIIPCGLFKEDSILEMQIFSDNDADPMGSVVPEFRVDRSVAMRKFVPLFSYETIMKTVKILNPSIIKIDAEGAEYEVLNTLQFEIIKHRPFILIEILSQQID